MRRTRVAAKPPDALYLAEFAARVGLSRGTLSTWSSRRLPRGNPVPDADGVELTGGKARRWWLAATADAWQARRPSDSPVDRSGE